MKPWREVAEPGCSLGTHAKAAEQGDYEEFDPRAFEPDAFR